MDPEALEEELNVLEEVDQHIMARPDILCCLQNTALKGSTKRNTDEQTARRTPIPEKTTFAEGCTCTRHCNAPQVITPDTYHANTLA
jgi:hypothetical protein